jgi:hypothetical protein
MKKRKRLVSGRNVDSERSGEGSSGIPSQDNQDLSTAADAGVLIMEKSTRESQTGRVWMLQTRVWSIVTYFTMFHTS